MGKTSLVIIGLAVTILSLITVDSRIPDIDNDRNNTFILVINVKHTFPLTLRDVKSSYANADLNEDSTFIPKLANFADIILKFAIFVYCCLGIGALCDEYFVPSLELIGQSLSLPSRLTSVLLIPLGTSGPEIFSSAVGVLFTDNDIGTGSIIGSSIYNLLAIPAVCGFAISYISGKSVKLDSESLVKDLLLYVVAIIGLIFTIKDQNVDLSDALLLMVLLGLYIGVKVSFDKDPETGNVDENNNNDDHIKSIDVMAIDDSNVIIVDDDDDDDDDDAADDADGLMGNKYLRLILTPILILFNTTIPENIASLSLIMSLSWLSALAYISVWAITGVSEALSIPPSIAGMTILAAGSAVPDLATSLVMMRRSGDISSGISAAISSNIFAVLFGLGFPWLCKCALNQVTLGQSTFAIQSDALPYTSIALLLSIFTVMIIYKKLNWELGKMSSSVCGGILFVFISFAIAAETII